MCSLVLDDGWCCAAFASRDPDRLLPSGAFFAALGGFCYHMSNLHVAMQFPYNRGLVSSLYVGCFILSGIMYELLRATFKGLDNDASAYRGFMVALACIAFIWMALMAWVMPRRAFLLGDHFRFVSTRMRFELETREQYTARQLLRQSGSDGNVDLKSGKGGEVMMVTRHQSDDVESSPAKAAKRSGSAPASARGDKRVSWETHSADARGSSSRVSGRQLESMSTVRHDSALSSGAQASQPATDSAATSTNSTIRPSAETLKSGQRTGELGESLHMMQSGVSEDDSQVQPSSWCLRWHRNCRQTRRPAHDRCVTA